MKNNTAAANLIREGKTHQIYSVMETSTKEGMITLDRALKHLLNQGVISYDDAIAYVRNPKDIANVSR
jgi:twitching motility protein PilT